MSGISASARVRWLTAARGRMLVCRETRGRSGARKKGSRGAGEGKSA